MIGTDIRCPVSKAGSKQMQRERGKPFIVLRLSAILFLAAVTHSTNIDAFHSTQITTF